MWRWPEADEGESWIVGRWLSDNPNERFARQLYIEVRIVLSDGDDNQEEVESEADGIEELGDEK